MTEWDHKLEAIELKFLLKLLGYPDYRTTLSQIDVSKTISDRNRACEKLTQKELIGYHRDIQKFRIESAGKALLKQEPSILPLSEQQLVVLKACETKSILASELSKKIASSERQPLIQDLESKGFIQVEKSQIKDVWLTDEGIEFLAKDFSPGGNSTISLNLLGNYVKFLRQNNTFPLEKAPGKKPEDEEILQIICELDHELGTENYLPIFHLRNKLQPPLSRDELDQALYRLQRQDKLEMSSLVEASHYTKEEFQAGIPQDAGGPLFFLMVSEASDIL
ncbi:MAG: hypothetical protein SFW36_19495 [Leptolyngbyaceae cyanobacterium bins.59]|nr:hypothetical protein [Leptolyngbyaceae cyanobacterium bins.59]